MTLQHDGVRPVVEGTLEGDTWTTTARNVWEGDSYYSPLVLRLLPSGGYNYLSDGLGSTRQLMRHSDHAITDTYAYDAFGNTLTATGTTDNPYRYVGALGYRAGGGGLMQLGVRECATGIGRFVQPDPLPGWALGVSAFAYARNSPQARVDADGRKDCKGFYEFEKELAQTERENCLDYAGTWERRAKIGCPVGCAASCRMLRFLKDKYLACVAGCTAGCEIIALTTGYWMRANCRKAYEQSLKDAWERYQKCVEDGCYGK